MSNLVVELNVSDLSNLIREVRTKGIWFKELELEYRKNKRLLLVRFKGSKSMKLTSSYEEMVENQLKQLETKIIMPLIQKVRSNFVVNVSVDSHGRFSFSLISLKLKMDCRKGLNMHETFKDPFRVMLPFAEYIHSVYFRGIQFNISVVEAEMTITSNDLFEAAEDPLIAPRAKGQWYNIASHIYAEAKLEYKYDVEIPCVEGELYWDNKVETIQFSLINQ